MSASDPVVILGSARTPIGSFQGGFASLPAPKLGGAAVQAAVERSGLASEAIDEVLMGCVLPAGQGQAPARQAAVAGGLPFSTPATTVNKMCGSGMKTLMMAHEALHARPQAVIVAGGMESMTNAPHLLPGMRQGQRLGHGVVQDHMFLDGLEDAYDPGRLMGTFAEDTAEAFQFTREAQDSYAIESLDLATVAADEGYFDEEIVPVTVTTRKGDETISRDEQPLAANIEKIPHLRPAFRKDGTVTAANSSSISDGAAALVLARASTAERYGAGVRGSIVAAVSHAREPAWFTTAPIGALNQLLEVTGWALKDVDLIEINEAFAVVPMAAMHDLAIPHDILNIHGGACALGHPIGASGARIVVTLLAAMERNDCRRGIAAICIGGGEATAVAIERC
ncbi:MAG: acetyl-CoA C-acyltransferase [Rhizobiales bacterium]|nr:acetyl-CoA C-acyltransferase [Hyphomicrobiales bacterium]